MSASISTVSGVTIEKSSPSFLFGRGDRGFIGVIEMSFVSSVVHFVFSFHAVMGLSPACHKSYGTAPYEVLTPLQPQIRCASHTREENSVNAKFRFIGISDVCKSSFITLSVFTAALSDM